MTPSFERELREAMGRVFETQKQRLPEGFAQWFRTLKPKQKEQVIELTAKFIGNVLAVCLPTLEEEAEG